MPKPINDVIADRLRAYRKARNLTMEALAERCGGQLTTAAIGNLERPASPKRGRRSVTVQELLILADALSVPPVLLALDLGGSDTVEVLPGREAEPWGVFQWISGEATLEGAPVREDPNYAPAVLFRRYRAQVDDALRLIRKARAVASVVDYSGPDGIGASTVLPGLVFTGWLPEHREATDAALRELKKGRGEMRRIGFTKLPTLPPTLVGLDDEPPGGRHE